MWLPIGYQANQPLSTNGQWGGSFDSLGMTPGTYTWDLGGGDSFVIQVGAVPEPSTCAMALAGLACGGYLVNRRLKRA